MELTGFRELLLKKSEGKHSHLQELIKYAKDELILQHVLESLEKMAQPSAAMGRGANSAITSYAGQLGKNDVEQVRDALAHHVSEYRGALKSGNREVADQHLNKIIPMMHLVGRAAKHSGGKLGIDYRSTTPWESNYTRTDRHDHNGKLKEGTKDLARRPKKVRGDNPHGVSDYRYLEMPAHGGHSDTATLPKGNSGYPFEETQVGSQEDIDAGKGFLPLHDAGNVTEYKPHPFDSHPIHEHADTKEDDFSEDNKAKFAESLKNWHSSPEHAQWKDQIKAKYTADPEAFKARGSQKPDHFWDGLSMQAQPDHAKKQAAPAPSPSGSPSLDIGLPAPEAAAKPQQSPSVQAPAPTAKPPVSPKGDAEALAHIRSTLTPEHIKAMTPGMRKILKIED